MSVGQKKPENAGYYYSLLQKKYWRIQIKAAIKAGNDKDEEGNLIVLEDSEDEPMESVQVLNEKYVPTRTREQFARCGMNDDYYGVLDLVAFKVPFYTIDDIEKQYRR